MPATLTAAERIQYEGWKRRAAERGVIDAFHALIRGRDVENLDAWIEPARAARSWSSALHTPPGRLC